MTENDTVRIVAILKATFPAFPIPDPEALVAGYLLGLGDCPYAAVTAAVTDWIRDGRPFFPAPSELRARVLARILPFPDGAEAWAEVRRGFSFGGLYREPAWSCAPLAQAVAAIGWRTLCLAPEGEADTVDRFQRTYATYRARAAREADVAALWDAQAPLRALIEEIGR